MKFLWCLLSLLSLVLCQVDFEVVVFTNYTNFTLDSRTNLLYSNIGTNETAYANPYVNSAMGEVLTCSITYTNSSVFPVQAALIINSTHGPVFEGELTLSHNLTNVTLPTVGPCLGNGLTFQGEGIYSTASFVKSPNGDYNVSCVLSRVYQYALVTLGTNYWMNFLPGLNSVFVVNVPNFNPAVSTGIKVIISRKAPSLPAPKYFFSFLALGTGQKCFNTGIPDETLPGVIEQFVPSSDNSAPIDSIIHVFSTPLVPLATIFFEFGAYHNSSTPSPALYHGYTVNFTTVGLPPPPPPPSSAGTIFGIVCGVLILFGVIGITYYFCVKRRKYAQV